MDLCEHMPKDCIGSDMLSMICINEPTHPEEIRFFPIKVGVVKQVMLLKVGTNIFHIKRLSWNKPNCSENILARQSKRNF